jgi:uracil-DNA glycosylase family 4
MTFLPLAPQRRIVNGVGRDTAKIAIVGDYTSPFDDKELTPFTGPAGTVLESCLHAAKLIRAEVYLTNVFKSKTGIYGKNAGSDFFDEKKKKFTDLGLQHVKLLREELDDLDVNVIVAAGNPALMALTDLNSVAKYRGYVTMTNKLKRNRKLIPTHSPMATIRTGFINRHLIVHDLKKAKDESDTPDLNRPELSLIYNYDTVEAALEWTDYYQKVDKLGFDIEVINYEVSCISFAASSSTACVIPFGTTYSRTKGWTLEEEVQLWRATQRILGNERSVKIAQNAMFDIHFLLTRCGVEVRGEIHDTMIAHSVMYPEFSKGLDFLGSIYCGAAEYWKGDVKFDNIKGES